MNANLTSITPQLSALAVAQATDLSTVYDGDAPAAARAGLRAAEHQADEDAVELWRIVCAIFDGKMSVEL